MDPMITCAPWNPVAMKNVLPYEESEMENSAFQYSIPWNAVNVIPKVIVHFRAFRDWFILFDMSEWWDQVIDAPDLIRMNVFRRGTSVGLNGLISFGGHFSPTSMFGAIALWKKAQKKETNRNTSEVIKRIIPVFSVVSVLFEWSPVFEASENTFLNQQCITVKIINIALDDRRDLFWLLNHMAVDRVRAAALMDARAGHGLGVTMWNSCRFFI